MIATSAGRMVHDMSLIFPRSERILAHRITDALRTCLLYTSPVIKKDELVKEENQVKQMDKLDDKVAVGTEDKEGVKAVSYTHLMLAQTQTRSLPNCSSQ